MLARLAKRARLARLARAGSIYERGRARMSGEGASGAGDVEVELLELLRQLAKDAVAEKFIGGKYEREVGPWRELAYNTWRGLENPERDGPRTLEALLHVRLGRLTGAYETKLETCKRHLRAFREEGRYGFTVVRHETVGLTVKVQWGEGNSSEREIVKSELRRDPANKYTIADGALMGELEKLVPFAHWIEACVTTDEQTSVVYNNEDDVNFGRGTAMRRLKREQSEIFGADPGGTSDIRLELHLLVDVPGGEALRRERGAVGGRVAGAVREHGLAPQAHIATLLCRLKTLT
jgi:hypothetical protein